MPIALCSISSHAMSVSVGATLLHKVKWYEGVYSALLQDLLNVGIDDPEGKQFSEGMKTKFFKGGLGNVGFPRQKAILTSL